MDILKQIISSSFQVSKDLKFDKTNIWQLHLVCLYASIVEFSFSIETLNNNKLLIAVPTIFRALFEAYIDLTNLANDKLYGYRLQANYSSEWLKILKENNIVSNPYLKSLINAPDLSEFKELMEKNLSEFKTKCYLPINQKEKFDLANKSHEYLSIYNYVCCESHNNFRALIDRHIKMIDEEDYHINLFDDYDADENNVYVATTAAILLESSDIILKSLGIKSEVNLKEIELNIKKLNDKYKV